MEEVRGHGRKAAASLRLSFPAFHGGAGDGLATETKPWMRHWPSLVTSGPPSSERTGRPALPSMPMVLCGTE